MRLTYLVMHAELEGLIVSGPMRGQQHTYALLAERLAGRPESTPDDPVAELWRRFVVGHGPTSVRDFARWSSLTLTAARAAAGRVADRLESATIGEEELWWDPAAPDAEPAAAREVVRLLPLYDELPLSYPRLSFPLAAGHPHPPDADLRWGSVIAGLGNVGVWRRTTSTVGGARSGSPRPWLRGPRHVSERPWTPSWTGWRSSSTPSRSERSGTGR